MLQHSRMVLTRSPLYCLFALHLTTSNAFQPQSPKAQSLNHQIAVNERSLPSCSNHQTSTTRQATTSTSHLESNATDSTAPSKTATAIPTTTVSQDYIMGWIDTWNDIHSGGALRWKILDSQSHNVALGNLERYVSDNSNILCPLAGDDPMVHRLWERGHSVTAIDLVPVALERMRQQFAGEWTKEQIKNSNNADDAEVIVWRHESGRATQYETDALQFIPELEKKFDAVYDKDCFGALNMELRQPFVARMAQYTKPNAIIYLEVKLKEQHEMVKMMGPPYSLDKSDLMDSRYYGQAFEHVESLGQVYPITIPTAQQTGHILRRK